MKINSIDKLARKLEEEGCRIDLKDSAAQVQEDSSPWIIKVLIGFSAWVAAFFLLGSFFILIHDVSIVAGIILISGAVVIRNYFNGKIFVEQMALAVSVAGQVMIYLWSSDLDSPLVQAFLVVFMEATLLFIYKDQIQKFISVTGSVLMLLIYMDQTGFHGVHYLVIILAVLLFLIFKNESRLEISSRSQLVRPVGYGLAVSLLGIPVLSILKEFYFMSGVSWWPSTAGVVIIMIILEWDILTALKTETKNIIFPVAALGSVILGLITHESPGIVISVLTLLIGFYRSNRKIMGLSIIFLLCFFIAYYYYMDVDLLRKSYILMGSGGFLLLLYYFFGKYIGNIRREEI